MHEPYGIDEHRLLSTILFVLSDCSGVGSRCYGGLFTVWNQDTTDLGTEFAIYLDGWSKTSTLFRFLNPAYERLPAAGRESRSGTAKAPRQNA